MSEGNRLRLKRQLCACVPVVFLQLCWAMLFAARSTSQNVQVQPYKLQQTDILMSLNSLNLENFLL